MDRKCATFFPVVKGDLGAQQPAELILPVL